MATVKAFRKGFYLSLHTPGTESEEFEHPNPKEIASWAKPVEAEITADSEVVVAEQAAAEQAAAEQAAAEQAAAEQAAAEQTHDPLV